ncbi:hypothetical protein B566_EDAN005318 [Ephemera danica]|nr:hypothetical protein B566_EDAN005318 [Ephemera danica]
MLCPMSSSSSSLSLSSITLSSCICCCSRKLRVSSRSMCSKRRPSNLGGRKIKCYNEEKLCPSTNEEKENTVNNEMEACSSSEPEIAKEETSCVEAEIDESSPSLFPELEEPSPMAKVPPVEVEWLGTPREDLTKSTPMYELPLVVHTRKHHVLYELPLKEDSVPRAQPATLDDHWASGFVRMPYSSQSSYPVKGAPGKFGPRWSMIESGLGKQVTNCQELQEAILSYNHMIASVNTWKFEILHELFEQDLEEESSEAVFQNIIPEIAQLALRLPSLVTQPIPLLKGGSEASISLSQLQIASLLANAFFCTFPRRNSNKSDAEFANYPDINFNRLFQACRGMPHEQMVEKIKCILNYFKRVTETTPKGVITFTRKVLGEEIDWPGSNQLFTKLHVNSTGTIEDDGLGMLQVDFANRLVGGGVLGHGCVQEEIRFVVCPELIVSRLFTEALNNNEALVVSGVERYNNYKGYSKSFEWTGDHKDTTPFDESCRRCCSIVAIDALPFNETHVQFKQTFLERELNKAFIGFCASSKKNENLMPIATGNWGCGAFGGDVILKAIIQMMAAAEAGRDIAYFTFGNTQLMKNLARLHSLLTEQEVTVGKMFRALVDYYRKYSTPKGTFSCSLLKFLKAKFTGAELPPPSIQRYFYQKSANQESKKPLVKPVQTSLSGSSKAEPAPKPTNTEEIQKLLPEELLDSEEHDEQMIVEIDDKSSEKPPVTSSDAKAGSFEDFWSPRVTAASTKPEDTPPPTASVSNNLPLQSETSSSTSNTSSNPTDLNDDKIMNAYLDNYDNPPTCRVQPKITNFFQPKPSSK